MNIRCPSCGVIHPTSEYGEGLKKKENPKWYEASDEYASKVCPSCGAYLRLSKKSKSLLICAVAIGIGLAIALFFWPFSWLLLALWVIGIFVIRGYVEFELHE